MPMQVAIFFLKFLDFAVSHCAFLIALYASGVYGLSGFGCGESGGFDKLESKLNN